MAQEIDSLFISIGIDPEKARQGFQVLTEAARKVDAEFSSLSQRWAGLIQGLISTVIAPVAGAFAIGKIVNSYMSDISQVATMTGAYSQKLEEWRIKRAMLARVNKDDIELYKKGREAIVGFRIAMADLSANIMREGMPVMKFLIDCLNKFTAWMERNTGNIVRSVTVVAGVLTSVFLPAFIKMGAAMLASPLTWVVAALAALALVVDDLVTYIQGGKTALSGFWSMFGTGEEILETLTNAFQILKEVISVLYKPILALAAGFAAYKTGIVIFNGLVGAINQVRTAFALLAANPLIAVFTALIGLIMWISDAFKRAGGDWGEVFDLMLQDVIGFLNIFGGFGDFLVNIFSGIGEKIRAIWTPVSDYLANLFEPFRASTLGVFQSISNIFSNFIGIITNGLKTLWAFITGDSEQNKEKLLDSLSGSVMGWIKGVANLVKNLCSLVFQIILQLPSIIWDVIKSVAAAWATMISGLAGMAAKAGSALFEIVARIGSSIWQFLKAGLDKTFSNLLKAPALVFNVVSKIAQTIFNVYKNILVSIGGAISSAINWVGNILGSAFDFFSKALQKSRDFAVSIFERIKEAVANFVTAVIGFFELFFSSAKNVFDRVLTALESICPNLVNNIRSFIDSTCNFFQGLLQFVSDLFSQIVDSISNALSSALDAVSEFVDAIFEFFAKIPEFLASVFDISGLVEKATSALKNTAKGAWDSITGFFSSDDKKKGSENKTSDKPTYDESLPYKQHKDASNEPLDFSQDNGNTQSSPHINKTNEAETIPSMGTTYDDSEEEDDFVLTSRGWEDPDEVAERQSAAGDVWAHNMAEHDQRSSGGSPLSNGGEYAIANLADNFARGLDAIKQELSSAPMAVDNNSIVNNSYQSANSQDNSQRTTTTTININAPGGNPRDIAKAVQQSLPNAQRSMDYVSASDSGNWNT